MASVKELCAMVGISRQGYYKATSRQEAGQNITSIASEIMIDLRSAHRKMGCGKMVELVNMKLAEMGVAGGIGRDACYELARELGVGLRRHRRGRRTTDSRHSYRRYPDLYNGIELTAINQAWVADITYWEVRREQFLYLHLVTDAYSRMIIGWCLSTTLHTEHSLQALQMALTTLTGSLNGRPIHHSDRGSQYCSDRYVHLLLQHGIGISQTQSGDPHDNAKAERINGTIKNEYLRHTNPATFDMAHQEVAKAVELYNNVRPHLSLNKQTPLAVHSGKATKPIIQLWKTKAWKKQSTTEHIRAVQTLPITTQLV